MILRIQATPRGYRLQILHRTHGQADVGDDPTRIRPDRWATKQVKDRHKAACIAFTIGPRMRICFSMPCRGSSSCRASIDTTYYREYGPRV